MFTLHIDDLTKKLLIKVLDKERKLLEDKILGGEMDAGTLILHEQVFKTMRGILYIKPNEQQKDPTEAESSTQELPN